MKELFFKKVFVTPEMAREMLDKSEEVFITKNMKQRKSRQATIDLYADDMSTGKWNSENGETIKITKDGAIADGIHRIKAVAKSNVKGVWFYIAEVEDDAILTIDIGLKRSLENALQMLGKAYDSGAAQIVRQKLSFDTKRKSFGQSEAYVGFTRLQQVEEYNKYDSLYNSATQYAKDIHKKTNGILSITEVGALYQYLYLTERYDKETIETFFGNLCDTNPMTSKTIYGVTMRNLQNKKVCRSSDRTKEFISCWNAYIKNRRTRRDSDNDWFLPNVENIAA